MASKDCEIVEGAFGLGPRGGRQPARRQAMAKTIEGDSAEEKDIRARLNAFSQSVERRIYASKNKHGLYKRGNNTSN